MGGKKRISFRLVAPSIITILALCAGLTAIKFAYDGKFEQAVFAIILAGVFDGLDGSVARLLKASSRFGAELDSLSDVVAFGVAPALVLYMWGLQSLGGIGWIICLLYVVCQALRLARYNSAIELDDEPHKQAGFLTGIPAPMGAYLALLPLMADFAYPGFISEYKSIVLFSTAFICVGMISKVPTYSIKQLIIRRDHMIYLLLTVGGLAASITTYGWVPVVIFGIGYMGLIPFAIRSYVKMQKELKAKG
jgi:CDP-diacylglycerol--serine O-phosphatidyltransferase